jgi:eukaryotic-like serine/threonine-protein kinase
MPLAPGTRLGPYEILSAIGAGGMGEVYRARDTRLQRDVAVKVLPAALSSDPDRLVRFEQEARAAAALNHAVILAVHDIGSLDGVPYIVSELLEGSTLRDRMSTKLPVRKALDIALQMAQGLAAAHEKAIVHRDLKPENVFLTSDGRVKILDFGLAKLTQPDAVAAAGMSALPTGAPFNAGRVSPDTQPGMVLGTLGYMAPEQVRGQAVDHRADIFAFGAILHEMLAGERAFRGETSADTMSAILAQEPPELSTIDGRIPPGLARIVDRCLEKAPVARFQSTRDLAFAIEAITSQSESGAAPVRMTATASRGQALGSARLAWAVASVALVVAAAFAFAYFRPNAAPSPQSVRFQIPPPGQSAAEHFVLSPDGRMLVFVATAGGADQLWVRPLDSLESHALAGTDGATYPFWSPDGAFIAFFAQGKLRKIAVGGGPPQILCDAASGRGGTWNGEGVILYSAGPTSPILRVAAAGGAPTPITKLTTGELDGHRFPSFLPDGTHFFYNAGANDPQHAGLFVGAIDGSASQRLLPDVTNAQYVAAPGGGYLVFRRDDTLMAQPFDVDALKFSGDMFPIAEQVPLSMNIGYGAYSVSATGTLAYRSGGASSNRELVWFDRTGKRLGLAAKAASFSGDLAISPDQRTIAAQINAGSQWDIWLQDATRDVITRFTFRPGFNRNQIWSPDGTRLAYSLQQATAYSATLFVKPASGGAEELLLQGGVNAFPMDWSSDGRWMVYQQQGRNTGLDLWLLPLDGDRKPREYLQTPFDETNGRFAPGAGGGPRWMAYQSNESGQSQVYIQSISPTGAKFQLSTTGGETPKWRGDGKELFYV